MSMQANPNLSSQQQSSMAKYGAMPIKNHFDGPAPIKEQNNQGVMQPNKSIILPKPGFF